MSYILHEAFRKRNLPNYKSLTNLPSCYDARNRACRQKRDEIPYEIMNTIPSFFKFTDALRSRAFQV